MPEESRSVMHCEKMVPNIFPLIASYVDIASFPSIAAMEAKQFKNVTINGKTTNIIGAMQ